MSIKEYERIVFLTWLHIDFIKNLLQNMFPIFKAYHLLHGMPQKNVNVKVADWLEYLVLDIQYSTLEPTSYFGGSNGVEHFNRLAIKQLNLLASDGIRSRLYRLIIAFR